MTQDTSTAAAIRAVREAAGLTQDQLAEAVGYDPVIIYLVEDQSLTVSHRLAARISAHLGCACDGSQIRAVSAHADDDGNEVPYTAKHWSAQQIENLDADGKIRRIVAKRVDALVRQLLDAAAAQGRLWSVVAALGYNIDQLNDECQRYAERTARGDRID